MIKSQLIVSIASKATYLTHKDIECIVNEILEQMGSTLSHGGRIEIRGFGSFQVRHRKARNARNPKTLERVTTLPKYVPHFTPGKELRERVNEGRHTHPITDED